MNITIEQKKQKALELMRKLDIYKPYIKGFEKDKSELHVLACHGKHFCDGCNLYFAVI